MMKRILMLLALLVPMCAVAMSTEDSFGDASTSDSSAERSDSTRFASDDDEVAAEIMGGGEQLTIDMLMQDYLSGDAVSDEQRAVVRSHLEGLSEDAYLGMIKRLRITRWWGNKGAQKEERVVAALLALVDELKEQTEQMKGSGELQEAALKQQIESAEFARYKWRMGFIGAVGLAIVTNGVQAAFNIIQANALAEQDTNSSSC
jgi:hypothetical protein